MEKIINMNTVQDIFNINDKLSKELNITHKLALPKVTKIVINAGIGKQKEDNKAIEKIKKEMSLLTGQMPVVKYAKKAIASFKIREGMPVGLTVTLRKERMMEFYDRLINIAMPRIKDFRGYSKKSFDGRGNITLGIKDHIIFPEISVENVENIFGFDITIATSAKDDKQGYELLKLMNFPFYN
jgi:large subunit ribosomal protein L5